MTEQEHVKCHIINPPACLAGGPARHVQRKPFPFDFAAGFEYNFLYQNYGAARR